MLNLNSVMLGSEDPKALAAFYGEVLQKKPDMEDNSYTGYMAGSAFLSVGPHDKVHGKSLNPERIIFFFETSEVEEEFNRIKAIPGAEVVKEPYKPSEDQPFMLATLSDPDGNYFQLSSPWNA